MTSPRLIDAEEVRSRCSPGRAVDAIEAALRAGLDPSTDLPRHAVPLDAGQFLLMPSQASTGDHVGVKVVTVAPSNPRRGLPRIEASYLLFDAATLRLRAMVDGTALTTLRTPAVSVAAVRGRLLASDGPLSVVVIGAGPQAVGHLSTLREALEPRRPITSATFLVRDPLRAQHLSGERVVGLGEAEAADALAGADVVVCATSAPDPLFDSRVLDDSAVVVAVGSHEPHAREVDSDLCRRATVVVEDVATALREAGDVVLAIDDGALAADALATMRDVVTGAVTPPPDHPLLFKSVGMSWEDLVVAEAVVGGPV